MIRRCLNVGCGKLQKASTDEEDWVNLDQFAEVNPDVVHNMTTRFPFEDNEFDFIQAIACLGQIERNADFLTTMNELWRVLKPGCEIFILLPNRKHPNAYIDFFNQRLFDEKSFPGLDEENLQYRNHHSYYGFKPWKVLVSRADEKGFVHIRMRKPLSTERGK